MLEAQPVRPRRSVLRNEVLLVLGVSLGYSAVRALVVLIDRLTYVVPLAQQTTALNRSAAPGRPWLDLAYQLVHVAFLAVPALLAVHLLNRDRDGFGTLGLDRRRPWFDLGTGAGLAAAIGIPGLGLYLVARELGINTTVSTANLPSVWWAVPVLILAAIANGVLEEVVVVGYLITRLHDLGWRTWHTVAASALLRGTYHLYQGFGAFIGNAIMGLVFALFFLRTRRVVPLVIAHALLDIVAYVGYVMLKDRLGFL